MEILVGNDSEANGKKAKANMISKREVYILKNQIEIAFFFSRASQDGHFGSEPVLQPCPIKDLQNDCISFD